MAYYTDRDASVILREAVREEVAAWLKKHNLYIDSRIAGDGAIYALVTTPGALAQLTNWFFTEDQLLAHLIANRSVIESRINIYKPQPTEA